MNILWDFDGTIFNTYPAYTEIFLEVSGLEIQKNEIYNALKISFSHAIKAFGLTAEQEQIIREKTAKLKPEDVLPFPSIEGVLQKSDLNVIMTHKLRKEVEQILERHSFHHYFIEIVAGDDGYPRKPHSASYQYLHSKYGLDLAIGDRELDIIPAKEIGIGTVLFQNQTAKADFYLENYSDFFHVVGKSSIKKKML